MKFIKRLLIGVILMTAIGFGAFKVFIPTLNLTEATKKMEADEQEFALKFSQIQNGASLDQVIEIFGRPPDRGGDRRPTWKINSSSQIATYFKDGKLFKIRWMKMPGFIIEGPTQ